MNSSLQSQPIKVMTVVGARPNFMKAAPILRAIRAHNAKQGNPQVRHVLVHTGQHYDAIMSDRFFSDLGLPKPDVHLGVGSGSHAVQTAHIMTKFEEVLLREKPQVIIVVGDVNSTLACSFVAAKISFDAEGTRPIIAHVEAGLRSNDRAMPEEVNRVATDHVSDLLFVTEESGLHNLHGEGVSADKVHFVGNTMIDSLLSFKEQADDSTILDDLGLRSKGSHNEAGDSIIDYALLTLHRPSNVDNRETFLEILLGLEELASQQPIIFPVHPRTQQRINEFGLDHLVRTGISTAVGGQNDAGKLDAGIILTKPLGYLDFMCLMKRARIVITDSGGIQEETTCLRVPCVTVRENTERPVTVTSGTNVIAGTKQDGIKSAIRRQLSRQFNQAPPKNWDGKAAERIVEILVRAYAEKDLRQQLLVTQECS
jgi:UDP-N-acetylglucosamine 2-epimerase (non-hydrolysing)